MGVILALATVFAAGDTSRSAAKSSPNVSPETSSI